jgi:hypothetical protein
MNKIKPCYIVGETAIALGFALRYKGRNEKPLSAEQRINQLDAISTKNIGNVVALAGLAMLVYSVTKKDN